mgnify:CR=1 FL=1
MLKLASMLLIAVSLLSGVTSASADTLADIRASGVYKIGYRNDVPPFSSADEPGKPQGFAIDICRSVAGKLRAQLGMEDLAVEYVQVTAANRLEAVARGDVHIVCGATTVTLSRQETVDFSNLFYVTGASFITTSALGVERLDQVAGKRIAVVENTTTLTVLRQRLADAGLEAKLSIVKDHRQALKLLEDGAVDALAGDRATLLALGFASNELRALRLSALMLSFEPYAFPVPRNDADYRLAVNRALSSVYNSGEVGRLWQQWFADYNVKPTQLLLTLYQLNAFSE